MNADVEQASFQGEEDCKESKYSLAFSEQSVRAGFIKKVFSIVTIMLIVVSAICCIPLLHPPLRAWLRGDGGETCWAILTLGIGMGGMLGIAGVLSRSPHRCRNYPVNLIFLLLFTLFSGMMTVSFTCFYTVDSVLLALQITAATSGSVVLFAIHSKRDLTSLRAIVFVLGVCLMVCGVASFVAILFFRVYWVYTVYAALGALVSILYLAIDVQMLMGKKEEWISPEDYIVASLLLFLDILNLFMFILSLFGKRE